MSTGDALLTEKDGGSRLFTADDSMTIRSFKSISLAIARPTSRPDQQVCRLSAARSAGSPGDARHTVFVRCTGFIQVGRLYC